MNRNDPNRQSEEQVVLAVVGAAHGIRGEVRVRSYTEDPAAFGNYGTLAGSDGKTYRVISARLAGNLVIARLAGIEDRSVAEALNGIELSVSRAALDRTALSEEEYFHADLIGLRAQDADGTDVGIVSAVYEFGGGDMLEIQRPGAPSRMIPFSRAAVPLVEIEAGRIVLDPAAAGLLDEEEE